MKDCEKKIGAGITFSAEVAVPVVLLTVFSFLKTFAVVLNETAVSCNFIERLNGAFIPQVLIATGLLYFALSFGLFRIKEKVRAPAFAIAAAAFVSLALFFAQRFVPYETWPAVQMVWKTGFYVLLEAAFWITAFRFGVFKNKHKTLIALVAAQILASIIAAGFIRLLVLLDCAETLLPWACIFAFAAAIVADILIANGSAPIDVRFAFSKTAAKSSGKNRIRKTLNIYLFVVAGLLAFCSALFDYRFWSSTAQKYATVPETLPVLYALLSVLFAVLLTAGLLASATRHIAVLTLSTLFIFPVALLAGAVGGAFNIFGLIIAAKAVSDVLACQVKEPVLSIIPRAVSQRLDFRTNVWRKTLVEPSSVLAAGILLLLMEKYALNDKFSLLLSVSAVLLLVALLLLRRSYTVLVSDYLKGRLWRGGRLMIFGNRLNERINDFLSNASADDTIYALRILEEAQHPKFPKDLEQALHHPSSYVRLFALNRIEEMDYLSTVPEVSLCAETDPDYAVRRAAIKVMCLLGGAEEREKALLYLNDPNTREGALIGLTAAGAEGVFVAIDMLNMLASSKNPDDRALAASVLGDAGNQAFYRPLTVLLQDEDETVCKAAAEAAGKLKNERLLPSLMQLFRRPELREDAVDALLQFGNAALPEIEKVLTGNNDPVQFRVLLAKTLGRMKTPQAEEVLFRHIDVQDRRVRYHILKSLVLLQYKAQGRYVNKVRLGLYDEIEWATNLLAALEDFEDKDDDRLGRSLSNLRNALECEIEYAKERILLLVALLHPSQEILNLLGRYALIGDNEHNRMGQIIERILTGELRMLCLPLFRKTSPTEKLTRLRPYFLPPVLSFRDRLEDLLELKPGEADDWTRASVVYLVGYFGDSFAVDALVPLLKDNDAIIRETTVWALGRLMIPEEASRLLKDSLSDPSPAVARMARFITDGTGRAFF